MKPILIFQGEQFEVSDKHARFKNLMIDFFKYTDYEEANIAELKRVLVITATTETKMLFRHYEVNQGKPINETDVKNKTLSMSEIGPHFDLVFRRENIAPADLYKAACKKPKLVNPDLKKFKKN